MWRTFLTNAFKSTRNFRRLTLKLKEPQGRLFKTAVVLNCTAVALVKNRANKLSLQSELKKACIKNNEALKEVMQVIAEGLEKISKQYQANMEKQIEIITRCSKLGPVGEHWDELTEYRVRAAELKEELLYYAALAEAIEPLAYNQAVAFFFAGVHNAMDIMIIDYSKLKDLVIRLTTDNYQLEVKVLQAYRDSISTASN